MGIAAAAGFAIQLTPIHALYRWALWGVAAIAILAVPLYMAHLDYYVSF